MGLNETVAQWRAEGKLDAEYRQLQQILEQRKFTRSQIEYAFNEILAGCACWTIREMTQSPDLEQVRHKLQDILSDEIHVIESCGTIIELKKMPKEEGMQYLLRATANRLWAAQDPEE